jgi:mono/diheme cytochrome c family protein
MRAFRRIFIGLLIVLVVAGAGFLAYAYRPSIDPLPTGPAQTFDASLVAHGAELAQIGDCTSCHTAPGGKSFAGGLAVPTPFGTIYSTNITPDRGTGIGGWTEAAFQRAMHEGVDRQGNHLYPAFPFDHFTHVSDDDNKALYAFLMTRDAVSLTPPANQLPFPFSFRPILAGWKLLFLKQGPLAPVDGQSDEWKRGYYLAEGLGHCAACHSPRNALGAEDSGQHFDGSPGIEGWYAYPISDKSPAPMRWNADSLAQYLSHGFADEHGAARGPMAQVTANLKSVSPADVHAIATYVASQMGTAPITAAPPLAGQPAPAPQSGDSQAVPALVEASADVGQAIYAGACSSCHEGGRPQPFGGLDFHLSTAVHADNPQNIVNMVLFGLPASEGQTGAIMPGYNGAMTQDQIVALLNYLRSHFTDKPAWSNATQIVADTLSGKTQPGIYSADGVRRAPLTGSARTTP